MNILNHIRSLFDDAFADKWESAMMHACSAVEGTAKALYPSTTSSKARFIKCLREYYWLIEPMSGVGMNMVETRFENLGPPLFKHPPDFAEMIYYAHRCPHAHGDEVPEGFKVMQTSGPRGTSWCLGKDILQIPDRVIWALASVAVFSRANHRQLGKGGDYYLSWGEQRFLITEWWGRESDVRPMAQAWNTIRVKMDGLGGMRFADPATGQAMHLNIGDPYGPTLPWNDGRIT